MPPGTSGPIVTSRLALVPSALGKRRVLALWGASVSSTQSSKARLDTALIVGNATSRARFSAGEGEDKGEGEGEDKDESEAFLCKLFCKGW